MKQIDDQNLRDYFLIEQIYICEHVCMEYIWLMTYCFTFAFESNMWIVIKSMICLNEFVVPLVAISGRLYTDSFFLIFLYFMNWVKIIHL